ncbi:LOW QUALITY PROTEIN: germ cell-specific gene 1-like protein [Lates calcarifer]|uniref:LOW QUALITY PROTEIN: germ cell-specific gene 1-like protein n=1 Tax=Lates calcarifer TaxID=8187 RepID=A0AAJ7LGV2_LATCA|nr:LOW QUALITY PROTEIN: germ cell-specific gene 1-like protein [Lates calcarifer]
MAFLQQMRSPRLSFIQTVVSLFLGGVALMSSYWCVGKQKVPKPLCSPTKHSNCIPVPGVSNSSSIQFSWETGDDRFVFPTFHTGLFVTCEENIYTDAWEEKCRGFHTLPPGSEKAMMWLSLSLELMYIGLLLISCTLLSMQLCLGPGSRLCNAGDKLLNAFAAVFTVLGGLLGMVGHMMFMQVFQTTASMGPEDFKPHSYGYSWAFYVAWFAFTVCMSAGVSTLNNYTKKVLMVGPRRNSGLNPCSFNFVGLLPPAPYYTPPNPALACPPSPPRISHLSPYYEPPPSAVHSTSAPRLTHSQSLPLPNSDSLPPPPSHQAPASPFHRLSLPSPSPVAHAVCPHDPAGTPGEPV